MTTTEPKIEKFGRYSTAETAKLLGIHRDTLYKYNKRGWIKCGFHKGTRQKFYLGAEIARFWKAQI